MRRNGSWGGERSGRDNLSLSARCFCVDPYCYKFGVLLIMFYDKARVKFSLFIAWRLWRFSLRVSRVNFSLRSRRKILSDRIINLRHICRPSLVLFRFKSVFWNFLSSCVNSVNGYLIETQQPVRYFNTRHEPKTNEKIPGMSAADDGCFKKTNIFTIIPRKSGHWTLHHLSWPFSNIFRFLFWCRCRASRDEAVKEKRKLKFKSWKASLCRLNEHKQNPSQALNAENQINGDHHKARGARSDRNCLRNKFLAAPELKNGNILKKRTKKTRNASMEKDEPAQERSNLNKWKQHFLCGVAKKKILILCVWREEDEAQCTLGASIRMVENLFSTHSNLRCQLLPASTIILIEGFRFYHCTFELRFHSSFMSLSSCGGMKWNWYDEKLLFALS